MKWIKTSPLIHKDDSPPTPPPSFKKRLEFNMALDTTKQRQRYSIKFD